MESEKKKHLVKSFEYYIQQIWSVSVLYQYGVSFVSILEEKVSREFDCSLLSTLPEILVQILVHFIYSSCHALGVQWDTFHKWFMRS